MVCKLNRPILSVEAGPLRLRLEEQCDSDSGACIHTWATRLEPEVALEYHQQTLTTEKINIKVFAPDVLVTTWLGSFIVQIQLVEQSVPRAFVTRSQEHRQGPVELTGCVGRVDPRF